MKRTVLFALMILLLLPGCGGADREAYIRSWQESCSRSELRFEAHILTQDGEGAFACSVTCRSRAGETELTLTAPETVAGVRFRATAGERSLAWEGAELVFGPDRERAVSPAEAVPLLLEAIHTGRLLQYWQEDDCLVAVLETESAVTVTLWLKDGVPLWAQLGQDGYTAAQLQLRQWEQKEE